MGKDDLDAGKAYAAGMGASAYKMLQQAGKKGSQELAKAAAKRAAGAAASIPLVDDMLSPDEVDATDDLKEMKKGKQYLDDNEAKAGREEMKKGMSDKEKRMLLEQEEEGAMEKSFRQKHSKAAAPDGEEETA